MIKRSLYTLGKMLKHQKQISAVKDNSCLDCVINLSQDYLKSKEIKYLALDFDGVLTSHGKNELYPEVVEWLDDFSRSFGQENIFILSNKPEKERLNYFREKYPKIRFIDNVAKKPYPDGMLKIKNLVNCDPKELALVDDRLLTGCLACILAGSQPILITRPYVDRENYDRKERFFNFLRYWEQKIFF